MSDLVDAADAAYPFDYATLPPGVTRVLGYVGMPGHTPHMWTRLEVAAVHASGRDWHPIVTVPIRALTASDGLAAATCMITTLPGLGYAAGGPVFLDVERDAWLTDPAGARACIAAWGGMMAAHGWPTAVAYLPLAAGYGWVASWTDARPDTLPAGWEGQQYAGNAGGGAYDLSVFDPAIFADTGGLTMADVTDILDAVNKASWDIRRQVQSTQGIILNTVGVNTAKITAAVTGELASLATITLADVETALIKALGGTPPSGP
jgi:hypothetical protein